MKEKVFCFMYAHPVVFTAARIAVNISVEAQVQFYKDGTVRTVDILSLRSMEAEIPVSFIQLVCWDLWEAMDMAALDEAQRKFNSPVNS